ncbi:MAG TPA: ribonuclease Z [Firmicutes bacterium]|nr:ribonuclease Z [Bacillota bacterium]
MILIVCVDDSMGMAFNHRRQSMDSALRARILDLAAGNCLWMSPYSAAQFSPEDRKTILADERFFEKAGPGNFCFAETTPVLPLESQAEELILFHWNRRYPADLFFEIPLEAHGWKRLYARDFPGNSHKMITEERYRP